MATKYGTQQADTLNGTADADKFYGYGGNDILSGLGGNDWFSGGLGNDDIDGGDGHDKLYGDEGNDELHGGYGDDTLYGGEGDDYLMAGGGSNLLYGGSGNDRLSTNGSGAWLSDTKLYGGTGHDTYYFSKVSNSTLVDDAVPTVIEYANEGIDTIFLGSSFFNEMSEFRIPANVEHVVGVRNPAAALAADPDEYIRVLGNSLNNLIVGTPEDDALYGGEGHDTLRSRDLVDVGTARRDDGVGQDYLSGGGGNDRLEAVGPDRPQMDGGTGNDTYVLGDNGYTGTDWAYFAGWGVGEGAGAGLDTVISSSAGTFLAANVEDLVYVGQASHTHLWGNALANDILGGLGADEIQGRDGDDDLDGGQGSGQDTIAGGNGMDVLRGWGGNDALQGDAGNDKLYGGADNDTLWGGTGDDLLMGETGNDQLYGGDGIDNLYGADGDDAMQGGVGNDTLSGGNGHDGLVGGEGDDYLHGGHGNDGLLGEKGNDTLAGFWGDDYLAGGWGADKLTGGGGRDTFRFDSSLDSSSTVGIDTITDFEHGLDTIFLSLIDANAYAAGDQAFVFRGTAGYQSGWNPGQLIVAYEGGNTFVRADYTGDNQTDIEIKLLGTVVLDANDFGL